MVVVIVGRTSFGLVFVFEKAELRKVGISIHLFHEEMTTTAAVGPNEMQMITILLSVHICTSLSLFVNTPENVVRLPQPKRRKYG